MNRQAVQTLKTYFGYDTFREGQESVVESILEHRDVLAIMPTGAGKSICCLLYTSPSPRDCS